jgi:hypothetical protein
MNREFLRQGYHLRIIQELLGKFFDNNRIFQNLKLICNLGHRPSNREIYDRYFVITKELNGIKVYLELGFFTDEASEKVPLGRTRFVDGQVENLII